MRRLGLSFVIALMVVAAVGAPGAAEPNDQLNREVSGPSAGTTAYDFFSPPCSFIHQVFDGSYETVQGFSGTFHIDVCITFGGPGDPDAEAVGSFGLTTPRDALLTGAVTGLFDFDPPTPAPWPFEFTLTPMTGTKAFQHVTGTMLLTAKWDGGGHPDIGPGSFSGTVVGSLQRSATDG
jgi:hypothetical protein